MTMTRNPIETLSAPVEPALLLELERDRIAVGELLQADTAQVLTTVLVALASAVNAERPEELRERVDKLRPTVRDELRFEVLDDGRGFDSAGDRHSGGLALMHARASALGGFVEIRSRSGAGTSVLLRVRKGRKQ
jgi:signal transduction histidine kinase